MSKPDLEAVREAIAAGRAEQLEKGRGLEDLAYLILRGKMKATEEEALEEFKKIKNRQDLMRYLTRFMNAINNAKATDGTLDTSKSADIKALKMEGLQKLEKALDNLDKATEIESKAKALRDQLATGGDKSLEKDAAKLDKEAKKLRNQAAELQDVGRAIETIAGDLNNPIGDKKLSREAVMTVIDGMRQTFDDLQSIHQLDMQTMSRLNNEANNIVPQLAMTIMKALHMIKDRMAKASQGR